ncbi:ABC transporter periplasmic binding domain protein [Acididesulfobacillus acetoxydans]|uniref:ABC transporter periplasmic binding domain protein n=1 Tax=Acididesulfobacillus acetoxydans TaxID=1561005 RepID=A0A8S0WE90_9FIRM|nr:ABC transporter substrate-binding protein [Acididesulfobacillus acetoxydans]CAA7599942.1 ABC transporter periplasmic binding domain protein [Acididesulfobacillus acetoxydans]CEJ07966.1 Periplasmic binding protein [Acididesulfobacillus acetoxydans]
MNNGKVQTVRSLSVVVVLVLVLGLAGCGSQKGLTQNPGPTGWRTITDMAGRKVQVPDHIGKVFGTSPVATIMVYTLAPDKLVGWNYNLRPLEKKYILPKYQSLPDLGGWYAKNTGNTEELLKIRPDVLLSVGTITQTDISLANRIQNQLRIPVVMVDAPLTGMDKAYKFLGSLLGVQAKAQELGAYCQATVKEIKVKAKTIPADKRVRVYYAEGSSGLQTDPQGSSHTETLALVGGINVAHVAAQGGAGMSAVSLEQVLKWNPDVILCWNHEQGSYYPGLLTDPAWHSLKAVQTNRVYEIPDAPFNWFDRPPSVNRLIGLKWLGNLLYPQVYKYDMVAETKSFYSMFYHYNLSDAQAKALLATSSLKVAP